MTDLHTLSCKHHSEDNPALDDITISKLIVTITGWQTSENLTAITRQFKFKNFYETIAFINAAAWIIHTEDHHPELIAGYNTCTLIFSTHSVNGLTLNDFICAAKINALLEKP